MDNIIKMLSVNKDFRMVIADTSQIAEKQLCDFSGKSYIRNFLEEVITGCTLLSAMNDFCQKVSFTFRLANDISIFCMIENQKFSMEYCDNLHEFTGKITDLFNIKSVLSITSGDWNTGLHTGTVEASIDHVSMLLSHFSVQREQLPSHFIIAGKYCSTRGLLMQPLPFADEKEMEKIDAELVYLRQRLENEHWNELPNLFSHLANVVSENTIE
jgi:redox-regulated HSP33 family molecular chaperone